MQFLSNIISRTPDLSWALNTALAVFTDILSMTQTKLATR